jgi:hypothetical protein
MATAGTGIEPVEQEATGAWHEPGGAVLFGIMAFLTTALLLLLAGWALHPVRPGTGAQLGLPVVVEQPVPTPPPPGRTFVHYAFYAVATEADARKLRGILQTLIPGLQTTRRVEWTIVVVDSPEAEEELHAAVAANLKFNPAFFIGVFDLR